MRSSSPSELGRHHSRRPRFGAKLHLASLAAPLLLALAGCAGAPPVPTLQLRGFLGAAEDGSYAYGEVAVSPGVEPRAVQAEVAPEGKEKASGPLNVALADAVRAAALAAGTQPARTVDAALGPARRAGFDPGRAVALPPADGASTRWVLEPVAGAPCELLLLTEGAELRFAVRLQAEKEELVVARLPRVGETWVESVLLLPRGRRALARTGSAWKRGGALYRTEGLAELEIGAALAVLLDARALANLRAGEREKARDDLLLAIAANPRDPVAHYNLACALALLGHEDPALLALGRAVELEERLREEALRDPDLDSLRTRVEFRLMIEPRSDELSP